MCLDRDTYEILLNSSQALPTGSSGGSHFSVRLKSGLLGKRFRFKKVLVPYSFYVCRGEPVGTITLEWRSGGINYSTTIKPGSYNANEMVNELNNKFSSSGDPDSKTWAFSNIDLKFTLTSGASSTELLFNDTTKGLMEILGFTESQTLSGTVITGQNIGVLNRPNLLGLRCPELGRLPNNIGSSGSSDGTSSRSYDLTIPVNSDFGDIIEFDGSEDEFQTLRSGGTNILNFTLYDTSNDVEIDLNGAPWSVLLEVIP